MIRILLDSSEEACASLMLIISAIHCRCRCQCQCYRHSIALHYKYTSILQDLEIISKKKFITIQVICFPFSCNLSAPSTCQTSVATVTALTAATACKYFLFPTNFAANLVTSLLSLKTMILLFI